MSLCFFVNQFRGARRTEIMNVNHICWCDDRKKNTPQLSIQNEILLIVRDDKFP